MATMTIAQALASTATKMQVVDTPVNIAAVVNNSSLLARVTLFTMNANGASSVAQSKLLYSLGSKFSRGGYTYTVRDTVAALNDPSAASALSRLGAVLSVFDSATNLLAAIGSPLMAKAASTVLSTNATLTLANLVKLEALPSFSVLPGQVITLADTAANLLALTAATNRAAIRVFHVVSSGTVTLAQAQTLSAMSSFAITNNATLTVAGNVAGMTTGAAQTSITSLSHITGVAISISDTFANLRAAAATLTTMSQSVARFAVIMTTDAAATAAQLVQIQPLAGKFAVAAGKTLTLADTAQNILSAAPATVALAQATKVSASASITADQLVALTGRAAFSLDSGVQLTVTGTLAALNAFTPKQQSFVSAETVQDTITALTAATRMPALATAIIAQLDAAHYTAAQAAQLGSLANGMTLTIAAAGQVSTLTIADTLQNLAIFAPMLAGLLSGHGSVAISPTNSSVALSVDQALNLLSLHAIDMTTYGVSVSDIGASIAAHATELFGHGFTSITVTSGVFAGSVAQLLDPTLHFSGATGPFGLVGAVTGSIGTSSAQLASNATVGANQLIALSLLPDFSVATGVTLLVQDTAATLAANATVVAHYATAVTVSGTAVVTASQAASLAGIAQAVGVGKFSLDNHALTVSDSITALTDPANAAGIALATTLVLGSDAVATTAQATQLIAFTNFSLGGHALTVIDSAAALSAVAANSGQLAAVNAWGGQVLLSADATLTVAGVQALRGFTGFSAGNHLLTIADTAANLLATGAALGAATAVQLSADATVSVADATTLAGLHGFSINGKTLTVSDTPATLAANASLINRYATAVTVSETAVLTVAQANSLAGIAQVKGAGFSPGGHALTVTGSIAALTDPANAAGIALATTLVLGSDAVATAAQATQLIAFNFSLGGHALTVIDSAAALSAVAANSGQLAAVNAWGGQVLLSADATLTVAGMQTLRGFTGFSAGNHQLTIADTAANLLATGAALGAATAVQLSADATVSVADATTLAALHGFSTNGKVLTVSDTPAHLAAMSAGVAAIATAETFVTRTVGNAADFTLSAAQLTALMGLANLTPSGALTVSDTGKALLALAPSFTNVGFGSLLGRVAVSLSADAVTTVANAMVLAAMPGFSAAGHALTIHDTPAALLTPAASVAFGYASAVGISGPATVNVATATALAGLAHFAADAYALTIADTPANLAHMAPGLASIATAIVVGASTGQPVGDYTLSTAEFTTLANLPNLSFAGFSGAITVLDSAAHLGTLAAAMASAPLGSALAIARGAASFALSINAVVSAAALASLASLPSLSLNGHSLTLQDTPAALIGATAGLPLVTGVVLASSTSPWLVSAGDAARLALLPGFSAGAAGMAVIDSAAAILATRNAAGLTFATSVTMNADATVSAADAMHLAALANFTTGIAHLTVQDRAAGLAALSSGAAALASSIVVQGGFVSVAQFAALRALPHLTSDGSTLVIADTAANLALLAGTSTTLASLIMLGSDATLTAAQAEVLALLPHFVGGGAQISIIDSAANLLHVTGPGTRPDNWDGELIATTVTLSADATVTAAQAAEFATLGTHFSRGGNMLTVQDSVANLIGLSDAAQALATTERLAPGASVVVTAQQAAQLAALGHFTSAGATVTVSDTIAHLTAIATWHDVATSYVVADTLVNLAAAAGSSPLSAAGVVTLIAGGDIDAATAATLAGIAHFATGGMAVTVTDTPAHIVANEAAILSIGATARIAATQPISAAEADALAPLSAAGKLQFLTGNALIIEDSYAALSNPSHAAALLLAAGAIVLDTPSNVLAAAAHGWGTLAMSYVLSTGGTISAAQGATLAALGTRFQVNGMALVMADTAAAVAGAGATLSALNIVADVTDTTAHVVANIGGLIARGDRVAHVTLTDSTPVTAAQADALHYLAPTLAGSVAVNDTAVAIGQSLPNLLALGTHLGSVIVTDTAADVTAWVATLQGLGSLLTVTLTDATPVTAATAAALVPLLARLASTTVLAVQDTGLAIAGQASALAALGAKLGTVTLADGTTVSATVASGLLPVVSHLGMGVKLDVVDSAATLISAATSLNSLRTADRIHTIVAAKDTASHIVANAGALTAMGATATVLDSGAQVLAKLDALQAQSGSLLTSITLTDAMPPVLTMTVGTLRDDHAALQLITSPFTVGISDTAANIQGDLGSPGSTLVASLSWLGTVVASNGGGITLTEARAVAAGVADSLSSVMHHFSGGAFSVTGVLVSQIPAVAGLAVRPSSIAVADTAAHIQSDLASGGSYLLANRLLISGIGVSDSGTISLTAAQVRLAHVDDGLDSLFALMTGETLVVTGVLVSDIAPILALGVPPSSIVVTDSALAIQIDLALGGAGHILSHRTQIDAIHATGGTITLTKAQVLALHVDDGAGSALSKLDGATLTVTQVAVADIATIAALGMAPTSIRVIDTAANIRAALISGTAILGHLDMVSVIAVSDGGAISLTTAQAIVAGVDDGPNSALARMTGGSFVVTGATLANLAAIDGLTVQPSSISVSDIAANIQADLASGTVLVSHNARIATLAVAGGGAITLTTAQASAAGVDDGATSVLAKMTGGTLAIIDALITDFPTLDALAVHATSIAISDTLAHVQSDLIAGSPKLLAHVASLGSVTISDIGAHTLTLTVAQLRADAGVLAKISGTFTVDISDTAAQVQADLANPSSALLGFGHLGHISFTDAGTPSLTLSVTQLTSSAAVLSDIITSYRVVVNDTASAVENDLGLGLSSKILGLGAIRGGIFVPTGSTIHLDASQVAVAGVVAAIASMTGRAGLAISNASVAQIPTIYGYGISGTTIAVQDDWSAVQSDLTSGSSQLELRVGMLTTIALTGGTPIFALNLAQLGAATTVLGKISSSYQVAVADTAAAVRADLQAGGSSLILTQAVTSVTVPANSTMSFTAAEATFSGVVAKLASIAGLTGVTVTDATFGQFSSLVGHGVPGLHVGVNDTAAHLQADLASSTSVLVANNGALGPVTVSDGASVNIALSIARITATASVLSAITSTYHLTVSDDAATVQLDLMADGSSVILHQGHVTRVVLLTGSTITVSAAAAVGGAALALVGATGLSHFVVTGVSVSQIPTILGTGVAHAELQVSDTASAVQGDLGLGGSSQILSHLSSLASISLSTSSALTLTAAQVTYAGVADLIHTGISGVTGLVVNNALVSGTTGVAALVALNIGNTTINVADLAMNVQNDLMTGTTLLTNVAALGAITFTDGLTPTVTLSLAKLAADSAVVAKMTGFNLAIADSAANIAADLAKFADHAAHPANPTSVLLSGTPTISHVSLLVGETTMTLAAADVMGSGGLRTLVAGIAGLQTLYVSGTAISNVGTVAGYSLGSVTVRVDVNDLAANLQHDLTTDHLLANAGLAVRNITLQDPTTALALVVDDLNTTILAKVASYQVTVSDSAAAIASDLMQQATSKLGIVNTGGHLAGLVITPGSDLTVDEATAVYAGVSTVVEMIVGHGLNNFVVTGVSVDQLGTVFGLGVSGTKVQVSDTAAHVRSDLLDNTTSDLIAHQVNISRIDLTDGGTPVIALTVAKINAAHAVITTLRLHATFDLTVSDTTSVIHDDLAAAGVTGSVIINNGADHVTLSDGTALSLTETQVGVANVVAALHKFTALSLTVTDVLAADVHTLVASTLSGITTHLVIKDSLVNVQGALANLLTDVASITSITLTDVTPQTFGSAITTVSNLTTYDPVLSKIALPVPGPTAYHLAISDTAALIEDDLTHAALLATYAAHIGSVTLTGGGTPTLHLTMAELTAPGVAAVLAAISNTTYDIEITGSPAEVNADLASAPSVLVQIEPHLGAIALGGATISLSIAALGNAGTVLSHLGGGTIVINDTPAHISADLSGSSSVLLSNYSRIASFTDLTGSQIVIPASKLGQVHLDDAGADSVMAKLDAAHATLKVTDVTVASIGAVLNASTYPVQPTAITVTDSASNILTDLNLPTPVITTTASHVVSVAVSNLSINTANATTIYTALQAASPAITFDESALTISDIAASLISAASSAALTNANAITLSADASAVTAAEAKTLAGIRNTHNTGIDLNGHTLAVVDSQANLLDPVNADGINLATSVALDAPVVVSAGVAKQLAALHGFVAGTSITVEDSLTNLLASTNASGIAVANVTQLSSNQTVTASDLASLVALNNFTAVGHTLTLADTVVHTLALTNSQLGYASLVSVSDTAAAVTGGLAGLTAITRPLSITLTDTAPSITTSAADYTTNATVYSAVTNTGVITVNGSASALAAIASQLTTNAAVGQVNVTDTSAAILSNLSALNAMGAKFHSATVTDTSINAASVASLLSIPNLTTSGLTITDTGTQIAAAIQANSGGLAFMNGSGVSVVLSADSVVDAAGAATLSQLTHLTKGAFKIYIWDAAAYLTNGGNAAALAGADGVYLKAPGNAAQVNAAAATILLPKLSSGTVPPGITAASITVQDTAANLDTNYANLFANKIKIAAFRVSAGSTVTVAVLGELRTLGATMATGSLTARDTAANILAELATPHGASVTPASWLLSANGTVATAGAITLAGLAGFNAGSYKLTLSDDPTISVVDANTLAGIRTSLLMGGHVVHVAGTVTTVSGLSADAKLVVTPDITDTFAQVATLTTGSGLLGGTITISDTASVTVSQATAFLALLGGSGIPATKVFFGTQIESVTDTLANIQTLTATSGWTGNPSIRAGFHLTVADTVANLINGSNTTALATMSATTLAANSTVTAAAAETLFGLTTTIHFTKGISTLTIQDSAANLLNPVNTDGLTIADTVQLAADDAVNAADAETLLHTAHFSLNHVLTITDASANLLDGTLADRMSHAVTVPGGSMVVQLAGAETVDAGTASALAALTGFIDPSHYLSIADSASYLLNASNAAAEHLAAHVTLSGDETVSVATATRLGGVEHFSLDGNVLHLASNDYADASALTAIGRFGNHFDANGHSITLTQDANVDAAALPGVADLGVALNANGHSITLTQNASVDAAALAGIGDLGSALHVNGYTVTLTQDALSLTPAEYAVIHGDVTGGSVLLNGHAISALATGVVAASSAGMVTISGNGVVAATLNVYADTGAAPATTTNATASFTASASHASVGNAMVVTETVNGVESAPIIALHQDFVITSAGGATFASHGAVQVDTGKFVDLYSAVNAPAHPTNPILVYGPNAHTLSLNVNGHAPVTLVTLGSTTHPTSLTAAEIFIQHFT